MRVAAVCGSVRQYAAVQALLPFPQIFLLTSDHLHPVNLQQSNT